MDYKTLAYILLSTSKTLLQEWLPDGKFIGIEYVAKNPRRNDRSLGSFKINFKTGKWCDFATSDKGGDLISLYAYINNIPQITAAQELKIICRI